jgi:hypothetical protein
MIAWSQEHLAPAAPGFSFQHHDVDHPTWNPGGTPGHLPFPAPDGDVTLFIAWSVFTHLLEGDAKFYLNELSRVLAPDGVAMTTWFLFDKAAFPMMQEFQNALFINEQDPSNAVIFDERFLLETAAEAGLKLVHARVPKTRGYQWQLLFAPRASARREVPLPADTSRVGRPRRPPLLPADAEHIGR